MAKEKFDGQIGVAAEANLDEIYRKLGQKWPKLLKLEIDVARLSGVFATKDRSNWLPPLTYPPKTAPPRAKCTGESSTLLGKRIILNESEQITLKTKEITMSSFGNERHFTHA